MIRLCLGLVIVALTAVGFVAIGQAGAAQPSGPCGTPHDAMDAEEFEFLGLYQQSRDATLENSSQLTPSGPLNAAAAWYAQYASDGGNTGNGHQDSYGRDYLNRAIDCGWPDDPDWPHYGMGEGGVFTVTAAQAAAAMPYTHLGDFQVPDDPRYNPLKCIGVGRAGQGNDTVWIVLIAQWPASKECPEAQTSPVSASAANPSPSPSPTPTSEAVPQVNEWTSFVPGLTVH